MNLAKRISTFAILLTLVPLPFLISPTALAAEPVTPTIHVTGYAEQEVAPDTVSLTLTVTTIRATMEEAKQENDEKMNHLVQHLLQKGITKENMKTSLFQITPQYTSTAPQKIKGYAVQNTLTLTLHDFTLLPPLLSTATAEGITQVTNLHFYLSDDTHVREQLLRQATQNGTHQAQVVAEALQRQLGPVLTAQVIGPSPSYSRTYTTISLKTLANATPSTPIEEGTTKITTTIDLTFTLQ